MKTLRLLFVFAFCISGVGVLPTNAAQKHRRSTTAVSSQAGAPRLGNVRQFKEAFQNDAGKVRLVALVSPT